MEIADILGTDFKHFCFPPLGNLFPKIPQDYF